MNLHTLDLNMSYKCGPYLLRLFRLPSLKNLTLHHLEVNNDAQSLQ